MKWALVIAGLLYPILVVGVVGRLQVLNLPSRAILPPNLLSALTLILAVIGLINVVTPWLRLSRWQVEAEALRAAPAAGYRLLVMGLPFAVAPASYGLLLYFFGAPASLVSYFAGASFVAVAAWGARALLASGRDGEP
jgi:hypothetical protein